MTPKESNKEMRSNSTEIPRNDPLKKKKTAQQGRPLMNPMQDDSTRDGRPLSMTADAVRTWLSRYSNTLRERDLLAERLDMMELKAYGTRTATLDGLPRAPSPDPHYMDAQTALLVSTKTKLETVERRLVELQAEYAEAFDQIPEPKRAEKVTILETRYIMGLQWGEVTQMLYGSKDDYLDKEDSYMRRVHKYHHTAIEDLANLL